MTEVAPPVFEFMGLFTNADRGSVVLLGLGAANRDDRCYPNADRFDIRRTDSPHLAFSGGRHSCLGQHLARLELNTAFRLLTDRFPDARLADGYVPQRVESLLSPGLVALPVVLQPTLANG